MDYRLQDSSFHGIFQARILEWVAISFSRGSCQPRDWSAYPEFTDISFPLSHQGSLYFVVLWSTVQVLLESMPSSLSSSVQLLGHVWLFATPGTAACQASLSITNSQSLFKLMSIESVMPSNHLILCRPLLLMPSIFPSIRVFSNESVLRIMWANYWSFSFSISPSNEYSGLISFRIDLFRIVLSLAQIKHFSIPIINWFTEYYPSTIERHTQKQR